MQPKREKAEKQIGPKKERAIYQKAPQIVLIKFHC